MNRIRVTDICDIERSRKGKVYRGGSTLLQVSATRGQLEYLDHDGTVEDKYCVITPKEDIDCVPYYIYIMIQWNIDEFCSRYQTGLNIQMDTLKFLTIEWVDIRTQIELSDCMRKLDEAIGLIEEDIKMSEDMKKYFLDRMFPGGK